MKTLTFALRNTKELLRDKINLFFGLAFPVILLLLLHLIGSNTPVEMFQLEELTPGIAVFGLSFISLFSGMVIAKDRTGSLMLRLFTSPMRSIDFIAGYALPLLPIALGQAVICYAVALLLGLSCTGSLAAAVLVLLPAAVIFIGIGILCGCLFTEKQVGSICGALLTNVSAWLSGTWFDTTLGGKVFDTIAGLLPFSHAVDAGRALLSGNHADLAGHMAWVCGYGTVILLLAVIALHRRITEDK